MWQSCWSIGVTGLHDWSVLSRAIGLHCITCSLKHGRQLGVLTYCISVRIRVGTRSMTLGYGLALGLVFDLKLRVRDCQNQKSMNGAPAAFTFRIIVLLTVLLLVICDVKVMQCIHLNEEETTSSSRIFIKILFQELCEFMGLTKLNTRLKDQ